MAMTRVKVAELKDHLSEHLRAAERGAEVVVTDRDRPIARITPYAPAEARASLRPPVGSFAEVRARRFEPAGWSIDSLTLLREERRER
jgi:prevent-host-death family protein